MIFTVSTLSQVIIEKSFHDKVGFGNVVVEVNNLILSVDEDHLVYVLVQVLEEFADLADFHWWNDAFLAAESHKLIAHHFGPNNFVFIGPLRRCVVELLAVSDDHNC